MRWLMITLVSVLCVLQYQLWWGTGGVLELFQLRSQLDVLQRENHQLAIRNRILNLEVSELKGGLEFIEERARTDLGLIKEGETFYFFINE